MSRILELCFITGEACFYNSAEHYIIYAKTQARAALLPPAVYSKTAFRKQLFYFRLHSRCKILIKGTVWRIQFSGFIWRPPGEGFSRAFGDRKLGSHWALPRKFMRPGRRGTTSAAASRWMDGNPLPSIVKCAYLCSKLIQPLFPASQIKSESS